jgi:hypothetical protein
MSIKNGAHDFPPETLLPPICYSSRQCEGATLSMPPSGLKKSAVDTGTEADRSTVDYSLAGTTAAKIFNAMAALGIIAFTFGASEDAQG